MKFLENCFCKMLHVHKPFQAHGHLQAQRCSSTGCARAFGILHFICHVAFFKPVHFHKCYMLGMQEESILYFTAEIKSSDFRRIFSYSFSDSWQQNKSNHWTRKCIVLVQSSKYLYHVKILVVCIKENLVSLF